MGAALVASSVLLLTDLWAGRVPCICCCLCCIARRRRSQPDGAHSSH